MTPIEQAITEAITAGWHPFSAVKLNGKEWTAHEVIVNYYHQPTYLLDPSFWQALAKARGWGKQPYHTTTGKPWGKRICNHCGTDCDIQPKRETGCRHDHFPEACDVCTKNVADWDDQWHRFIDHLAEGLSPETFFERLLK